MVLLLKETGSKGLCSHIRKWTSSQQEAAK